MNALELPRKLLLHASAAALCLTMAGSTGTPLAAQGISAAQGGNQDEEVQMGQQVFDDLKAKA